MNRGQSGGQCFGPESAVRCLRRVRTHRSTQRMAQRIASVMARAIITKITCFQAWAGMK